MSRQLNVSIGVVDMVMQFEVAKRKMYRAPGSWAKPALPADAMRASLVMRTHKKSQTPRPHLRIAWGSDIQRRLDQRTSNDTQIVKVWVSTKFYLDPATKTGYLLLSASPASTAPGVRQVDKPQTKSSRSVTLAVLPEWIVADNREPVNMMWQWSDDHGGVVAMFPPEFIAR